MIGPRVCWIKAVFVDFVSRTGPQPDPRCEKRKFVRWTVHPLREPADTFSSRGYPWQDLTADGAALGTHRLSRARPLEQASRLSLDWLTGQLFRHFLRCKL